jgi:signal recognition particle subunit SRP54
MLNLLSNRIQKAMRKMNSKTILTEENIVEITREIKLALLEADVNLLVVKEFIKNIKAKAVGAEIVGKLNPGQQMLKIVKDELVILLGNKVVKPKVDKKPYIIMLCGLQGSGKTTTTGKIANYFRSKKLIKNPLMVAADVYRPAAVDQLKTLGKQLSIDVYEEGTKQKPETIVKNALKKAKENNNDFILIDTAGRLSIDEKLMKELVDIKKVTKPNEVFFVADAMSGQDVLNVAKTFHEQLELTGTIITKLDSDARGGAALSIVKMLNIPVRFIGTGEKLSNLDLFHPDRMADRILGMGDVLSIIEKASEVIDEKKAQKLTNRMMAGKFDLNDLLEQLKQMKKLGKLSKLIGMLPGGMKISKDQITIAERKQILFEILICSMTVEERKFPKLLKNNSRKQRIISGSGRSAQEYNSLVNEFERMAKQMKGISKSMSDGTFNPGMMNGLK